MRKLLILTAALAALSPVVRAAEYEIDADHSEVGFKVRHLVGKVPGRFSGFSGKFSYEPGKPETWKAEATIDPASINTGNAKRDAHLKGADFFDTAKCPAMGFKSGKVSDVKGERAKLAGELTMHCVTKPVLLDLELGGVTKDPWGGVHAGFTAHATINRKDFGIVWNKTLDNGGVMIGDEVVVTIEVEGKLKTEAAPTNPAK